MKEISIITDRFITEDESCGYQIVPRGSIIQMFQIMKHLNSVYSLTFSVFQMAERDDSCLFENMNVHTINANNFDEYKKKIKKRLNSQVIHFNNVDLFLPPYKAKYITATIHTNAFLEKKDAGMRLQEIISEFDNIVVVNESYAKRFRSDNMVVIHNGVDTSLFPYVEKVAQLPVGLFFPNMPSAKKNFKFALDLTQYLNRVSDKIFNLYVPASNCFGIDDNRIFFMGGLKFGTDMHKAYKQAFITLIPSVSESCSLCMLESMSSGTVIIANNITGLRDYMVHNETGFLLSVNHMENWAALILNLLENPHLYKKIAVNAHRHIENKYTLWAACEKYYRLWSRWL